MTAGEDAVGEELVALYDAAGAVIGSVPRSRMRAENLHHGATGVLVRNRRGFVYVHRRTDTKDVYPGLYDFTAGGVIVAGESPDESAARELAEELGVSGVPITPVGTAEYADERTRFRAHLYEVTWDGEVRHQPEEVAWGAWWTPRELAEQVAAEPDRFMPDSVALWADRLAAWREGRPEPSPATPRPEAPEAPRP